MSWLNSSLNTIKGQLTTLAQEVLAETAGPGDEEYVATPADSKAALEVLADAKNENEQWNKKCGDKDAEIAILRKQITELQNKISDSGGGNRNTAAATSSSNSGRTSKSPTDQSAILEDSWCWEPENAKSDNDRCSETSSGNGAEMVNITLEEVPLDRRVSRKTKHAQRQPPEHTTELQKRVQQLEEENKQLNVALEELDAQHNQAMQNVLELKTELQSKLSEVNKDYASLKKEHAEKFINGELEFGRIQKQNDMLHREAQAVETQKQQLLQKNEDYDKELKNAMVELADLQALLEKKDKDNLELIQHIKAANQSTEKAEQERQQLQERFENMRKEFDDFKLSKEKKNSESSTTGSSGKQSEDEFIVVREGDANASEPSTPPTKEELKDKIVQLENRLSELTLENGSLLLKLQDSEMEKELAVNVLKESLQQLELQIKDKDAVVAEVQQELEHQRENIQQLKEKAAETVIANEQVKALAEEKLNIELEISKLKELLAKSSELEKRLLIAEQEKETLQLETQTLRSCKERLQELEQKIQTLNYENQQLKLNAEAETETLNNSAELEEKLKSLADDNESMRLELDNIAQAKFSQIIAEEKRVTDLDADEESEEPFDYEKLRDLLANYFRQDLSKDRDGATGGSEWAEKTYKALRERLWQVDSLEKNLTRMSEDLLDLRDSKLVWEHEKKTLEADISQYILQCDELMKNNEILLNELENYKRNKLETISENNEENMLQLESQLEECTKLNRTLEEEYAELNEKINALEHEKQELTEKLRETQTNNLELQAKEGDYQLQIETLQLEKCNLQFEFNEWKSSEEKNNEAADALQELAVKCNSLESQLVRLSKDHADLVAAMQAQKSSLLEAHKKRDELEKIINDLETLCTKTKQEMAELQAHKLANEATLVDLKQKLKEKEAELVRQSQVLTTRSALNGEREQELHQELLAKDIIVESMKTELIKLQKEFAAIQSEMSVLKSELESKLVNEASLQAEIEALQAQPDVSSIKLQALKSANEELQRELEQLQQQRFEMQTAELGATSIAPHNDSIARIAQLEAELLATADLQKSLDSLNYEKQEMIKALQQKHAENMQYYMEIQRMQPIIQQLQQQLSTATNVEKSCSKCPELEQNLSELKKELEKQHDQINFLKEKSDILTTNLLTEQTNQKLVQQEKADVVEQNAVIRKDIERLRAHLLEIEDMHTQETVEMQRELDETKAKMFAMQDEVSKSSNAYTSASIRANQHAETLQAQYALVVQQRDELVAKLSLAEDRESKNQAALCNLQCALEQFQNDREHDIKTATQRMRKELQHEQEKEAQLRAEIGTLNQQLADANQGLRAATRLSDQLEACQLTIAALREEVDTLKSQKLSIEQQLKHSESSQTDKIDKNLIKSLLIGYVVSGNPNDKTQVLRMISSVLDFTQNESNKVGLNKQQTSWLGSILGSGGAAGSHSNDNLVQAFVQFLEQESQPKVNQNNMPNLLNMTQATTTAGTAVSSRRTSVSSNSGANAAPIPMQSLLLNSNVIDEFAPSRNSSSILKDILNDT